MKLFLLLICILTAFAEDEGVFIREYGLEKPRVLLHTDKWGVLPEKVDQDKYSYKDQPRHLVDWERLDPYNWLDFNYWVAQRTSRDQFPDWRLRLRDSGHTERVAQVIQCVSRCQLFKTMDGVFAQYSTRIHEGDELVTGDNSYAWLMLIDGTLVRVSPNTSISFNDVNLSKSETQFFMRLNTGHIYVQPRVSGKFEVQDLAETDGMFLPLLVKKANREYYMIQEYQRLHEQEGLHYELLSNPGHKAQYEALNNLVAAENFKFLRDSSIIIAAANTTLVTKNAPFEIWHGSFNISLFKKYSKVAGLTPSENERTSSITAYFRGYSNRQSSEIEDDTWYQMDVKGKELTSADITSHKIGAIEAFVKRIPSILIARELMLRQNYQFNFWEESQWTEEKLAVEHGHRLWNMGDEKEMQKRHDFLLEYTRRTETANLSSIDKLKFKYSNDLFDGRYISFATAENLKHLKRLGNWKAPMIKEMTETQYYVWMLKYGNKHYQTYSSECLATKKGATTMDLSSFSSTKC